jgi:hypothetical protein
MSGAAIQYEIDQSLETTRQREAAGLARLREADPDYDPWISVEEANRRRDQREAEARTAALALPADEEPDEAVLRLALANALAEREAATQAVTVAQEMVARARAAMDEADSAMGAYADLDQKLVEFRVAAIKRGETGAALPYALETAMRDRGRLVDGVDAAHKAYDALQREQKAAETALQDATGTAHWFAVMVTTCEIRRVADELREAEALAYRLRQSLASAAETQFVTPGVKPDVTRLPADVKDLLRTPPKAAGADPNAKAVWQAYHQRLLSDPEATLSWTPGATS